MKTRNVLITILLFVLLFGFAGCRKDNNNSRITIITTNFPSYDLVRAIVKDVGGVEVKMLVKPGSEIHDFEPTPQDIIDIEKSNMFIYNGGDSDAWIDDIINDIDLNKTKVIKMMDLVDLVKEEIVNGMEGEEEDEFDEHIWTSPKNAIEIIDKLSNYIIEIDSDNKDLYLKNAKEYIDRINEIDLEIRNLVASSKRREIVFGDRFPIRYFTDLYELDYYAAFKGCSEQSEASAKTISFLINVVKNDKIPVVFHIELSNGKIAETIAKETGAKVLLYHTAHNITLDDFNKGITYVDIMKNNIEALSQALN